MFDEAELYKELTRLTKEKELWPTKIEEICSLLGRVSHKIDAKVLWLAGEMGLLYPNEIAAFIPAIVSELGAEDPLLRERGIGALGRIGRGGFFLVEPYFEKMLEITHDEVAKVRVNSIWAAENIATNTPQAYANSMVVFARLLDDGEDRVRMEAPEFFRVVGKRIPDLAVPYLDKLETLSLQDENRVVRIHSAGAVKAIKGSRK